MSSETSVTSAREQQIDERLDAIDRALLGLVPRPQRLAIVAQILEQVQGQGTTGELPALAPLLTSTERTTAARSKRSRLALTAGILGMVGLAFLVATPIAYVALAFVGELFGETLSIIMLSTHALVVGLAGLLAVGFGGIALVRLARSTQARTGHGWAITGLCTGALPMLLGAVAVLAVGAELGGSMVITTSQATPATVYATPVATSPMECTTCPALPTTGYPQAMVASTPPLDPNVGGTTMLPPAPAAPAAPSAQLQTAPAPSVIPSLTPAPPPAPVELPPALPAATPEHSSSKSPDESEPNKTEPNKTESDKTKETSEPKPENGVKPTEVSTTAAPAEY